MEEKPRDCLKESLEKPAIWTQTLLEHTPALIEQAESYAPPMIRVAVKSLAGSVLYGCTAISSIAFVMPSTFILYCLNVAAAQKLNSKSRPEKKSE